MGSGYFSSQTFPRTVPHIVNRSHTSYLPAYEDGTVCSETSAFKLQTPENKPEEIKRHSEKGEIFEIDKNLKCILYLVRGTPCPGYQTAFRPQTAKFPGHST
jgi:hypothetical protein